MNKEQIDEIAFKVARESNLRLDNACGCSTCMERYDPPRIKAFTHALLAELVKVQEPVGFIAHNPGGYYEGSHIPAAPYNFAEFYGEMPTAGTKFYLNPLPRPDLVAEIDKLNVELETERMRLAACGVAALGYFDGCKDEYRSASLDDTLRLYASNTELRQQLSALQTSENELLNALETLACLGNVCRYGSSQWNAIAQKAITTHKTRKEKSE